MSNVVIYAASLVSVCGAARALFLAGHIRSAWAYALVVASVLSGCILLNLGPLGLILGSPSVVLSSLIMALIFRPYKEKTCINSTIKNIS